MTQLQTHTVLDCGIDLRKISDDAIQTVQTLQEAGFSAYLVGGCVRDLMLGRTPKDFDVATSAHPEEVKALFSFSRIIGRRFRIVHVKFGREVVEVATFRANAEDRDSVSEHEMSQSNEGQLTRDNVYGTIEEDVVRRDFTVNALYLDPVEGTVLDYLGGIEDVQNKFLRSVGDAQKRFREDPVRMLRVIRFASKLDFDIQEDALKMIADEGKLLGHVSPARLFDEVLKLFHGGAAHETYLNLVKHGLFKYLFPFTEQCIVDGVEGMPERALKNTDIRVQDGKPVIPAFLFACMMWDPVRSDATTLIESGTNENQAWRIAMNDALRDQNQYVAVPRRLAEIILDIWNIHFRLIKRNPRMVKACLGNRRFRAAYDFLLLRVALHEVDQDIADWWTTIQEVDDAEKKAMFEALNDEYRNNRRHSNGDANGNSVNYNQKGYDPFFNDGPQGNGGGNRAGNSRNNNRSNSRNDSYSNSGGQSRGNGRGQDRNSSNRSSQGKGSNRSQNNSSNANHGNNQNNSRNNNQNNSQNRRASGPGRRSGQGRFGSATNSNGRSRSNHMGSRRNRQNYDNNQPRHDQENSSFDNYDGNSPRPSEKKVKVRKKRRVDPSLKADEPSLG